MFGGLGMSFNICRGTLGSLAMFTAMRNRQAEARAERIWMLLISEGRFSSGRIWGASTSA